MDSDGDDDDLLDEVDDDHYDEDNEADVAMSDSPLAFVFTFNDTSIASQESFQFRERSFVKKTTSAAVETKRVFFFPDSFVIPRPKKTYKVA
jgi:hypothetical protein